MGLSFAGPNTVNNSRMNGGKLDGCCVWVGREDDERNWLYFMQTTITSSAVELRRRQSSILTKWTTTGCPPRIPQGRTHSVSLPACLPVHPESDGPQQQRLMMNSHFPLSDYQYCCAFYAAQLDKGTIRLTFFMTNIIDIFPGLLNIYIIGGKLATTEEQQFLCGASDCCDGKTFNYDAVH